MNNFYGVFQVEFLKDDKWVESCMRWDSFYTDMNSVNSAIERSLNSIKYTHGKDARLNYTIYKLEPFHVGTEYT